MAFRVGEMKKSWLIIIVLLCLFLLGLIYFKYYSGSFSKLEQAGFNALDDIKKQAFEPEPLRLNNSNQGAFLSDLGIISETNRQRNANGLPSLSQNARLDYAALKKANDMFKNQYFEHVSPTGVTSGDLLKTAGYEYILSGENLILGNFKDDKEAVEAWMNSPGHRENILNSRFSQIGVAAVKGIFEGQETWIGVQEFGLPLSSCPQPDVYLKNTIDSYQRDADEQAKNLEAEKKELDNTPFKIGSSQKNKIDNYNQKVAEYNSLVDTIKKLIIQYNDEVRVFNNCVIGEN